MKKNIGWIRNPLLLLVIFLSACSSSLNSESGDLCEWFQKSEQIRIVRIPAIVKVQNTFNKYDLINFDFSNQAIVNDLANSVQEYLDTNNEFIREWKKLGIHPDGETYWENELKAVELYVDGYSTSLRGFEQHNMNLIVEGARIYDSGNTPSARAEEAMINLRRTCR